MPEKPTEENSSSNKNELELEKLILELDKSKKNSTSKARKIKQDPTAALGGEEVNKRNEKYTDLLGKFANNYENTKKQTLWQKAWFFWIILIFFLGTLTSGIVLLFLALFNDNSSSIAVVIGASVEIFGSFIAIPLIIAKNLFPEKFDNDVIEIVKLLVKNDKDIRETIADYIKNKK